ncbi:hypothetical protein [Massilia sp. TWP1-3-3]|uniref:hypothetical protein n=1 Tax=Massilia sp. TWP1-3-3 TaxID=2804573 RepID=UPI003CF8502C
MNKLMMGMLLASAAAGTMAQTASAVDEVRISSPRVHIALPQERHNLWADEFDQVKGQYRLSNGKKMELSMWGNRMYVTIDGMPRSPLVAASPYVFVARNEQLKITINADDPYGPHGAELLMVVPRLVSGTLVNDVTQLVATR